jgi:hypothetical protein
LGYDLVEFNGNRTRVRYRVNTEPGSSGSPCFDRNWDIVALHHAGAYKDDAKDRFNQGIPIGRIVADLRSQGIDPSALKPPAAADVVAPAPCGFAPTLIVVCSKSDKDRALALLEQARIPPQFVARVGNRPPATVADNAIGVYLGSDTAANDPVVLKTISELRRINLQVVPVATDLKSFKSQTPRELHAFNAEEWEIGKPTPSTLRGRIRQLLGLEVTPQDRSVFICYCREDSRGQVKDLQTALAARSYDVFVDLSDIPLGDPVQAVIDQQLSSAGSQALLFVRSENAHKSKWIHDELLWAYTREIAIVVCQSGFQRNRIPLIDSLPVLALGNTTLAENADEIVKWLDYEIALSNTRNVQLARTLEGIARTHEKGDSLVAVESCRHDTSLMDLRYCRTVAGAEVRRAILVKNSARRPTTTLIQYLVNQLVGGERDAAILLYDAPETPLSDEEHSLFKAIAGGSRLWWIPREDAAEQLPQILDEVA